MADINIKINRCNIYYCTSSIIVLVHIKKERTKRSVGEEIESFDALVELTLILDYSCVEYFEGDALEYIPYYGHLVSMVCLTNEKSNARNISL